MAIEAIIFDCFGVLLDTSGLKALLKDYPQFEAEISGLAHQSDCGNISLHEFNDSIAKLIGLSPQEVVSRYLDINSRNEHAIRWIKELKMMGKYKLGMLSNVGQGWLDNLLPQNERMELFDAVILSSDVGLTKPDPKIFELMAERLGVKPHVCIMIDDTPINIDGASVAAMQGIVFSSINQAQVELNRLLEISNA